MKKNSIFILIIGIVNFALCFCLTYFCVPTQIPIIVDFNEKIILLCSKWILIVNMILPLAVAIIIIVLKNKLSFALKTLFVVLLYENMLAFCYFLMEDTFVLGSLSEIPLAISVFMPISALIALYAIKMKHLPYKSKFGIRTKHTIKTEFIWKQTHFSASEIFFGVGVLLFLISIVFIFVRMPWIELIIAVVMLIFASLLTLKQAKIMYQKCIVMEKNKEKLEKEKNKG